MAPKKDLTGVRFGKLTALCRAEKKNDTYMWKCVCDCGNSAVVYLPSLTKGATKSCGCLQKEIAATTMRDSKTAHGKAKRGSVTKEYRIWGNMKKRCQNENTPAYKDYGGRGITVDYRWQRFENFFDDMGECPVGHSLERVDNSRGYGKENCVWATKKAQSRNTRRTRIIKCVAGEKSLAEWAECTGLTRTAIALRIDRYGWSVEQALGLVKRKR